MIAMSKPLYDHLFPASKYSRVQFHLDRFLYDPCTSCKPYKEYAADRFPTSRCNFDCTSVEVVLVVLVMAITALALHPGAVKI